MYNKSVCNCGNNCGQCMNNHNYCGKPGNKYVGKCSCPQDSKCNCGKPTNKNCNCLINDQVFEGTFPLNEGFIKGSMFPNVYSPYGQLYDLPCPRNEQEAIMRNIQVLSFAVLDLGLYLDTHPTCNKALCEFNKYNDALKMYTDQYEYQYGPLSIRGNNIGTYPFEWIESPWPWDGVM